MGLYLGPTYLYTGVAQLAEQRSPKPQAGSSSLSARAILRIDILAYTSYIMNSFFKYVQESYDELRFNVTWPTWQSLYQTTIVVIIASIMLALLIAGMDYVWGLILGLVYSL